MSGRSGSNLGGFCETEEVSLRFFMEILWIASAERSSVDSSVDSCSTSSVGGMLVVSLQQEVVGFILVVLEQSASRSSCIPGDPQAWGQWAQSVRDRGRSYMWLVMMKPPASLPFLVSTKLASLLRSRCLRAGLKNTSNRISLQWVCFDLASPFTEKTWMLWAFHL